MPSSDHTTPSWTSPSPLPPSLGSFSLSTPFQHSTVHTLAHHDAHTNTSSSSFFNFQTLLNSYSSPCFHFTVNTTTPPTRYLHTHTHFVLQAHTRTHTLHKPSSFYTHPRTYTRKTHTHTRDWIIARTLYSTFNCQTKSHNPLTTESINPQLYICITASRAGEKIGERESWTIEGERERGVRDWVI